MRVIITGDKSRYQFLRHIVENGQEIILSELYTEKIAERDIYLTSDRGKIAEDTYYTSKLPLNTELCFPKETWEISDLLDDKARIIVFDEFPYGTSEDIGKFESLIKRSRYSQLEVVLFQNNRAALDTDITTEAMALDEVEKLYKRKHINVHRYQVNHRPDFLFWSVIPAIKRQNHFFYKLIDSIRGNIETYDSCYDLRYELFLKEKIEDPAILNRFIQENKKLTGKNVWDVFCMEAYNYYFITISDVNSFCVKMYKLGIGDSILWDIEKDVEGLKKDIQELFLKRVKPAEKLTYRSENYDEFINHNSDKIIDFKMKIKNFFAIELKQFLKERIIKKMKKVEELIG